eukprot:Gregarina_sp_Poly_1__8850@NODE_532_length_7652_cov_270_644166_g422_i0_p2_GENE_NODE_532_length_7652_cov_270_644166_g422_i0NODE_532_length_7652_cov_270_644166_g422_i0_p2_ORF_typecomplete_len1052_score145_18Ank_5/PF13857_6/1_3e06Ank_5/PF13857_6/0_0011Ank_2/PF12796_7/1_3e05Ank_2/PF12796_7/0_00033Ank_4/PF13637_6/0_00021Ank_4/PF13637_6/0_0043Ank/PF00023_30/7_5e02Ank/PF00023_30/0_00014Ank/PF00023_30/0_089Ank_3/PF13606_6/6_3e03Ank_3/PF13606_6/4_1e05Ank_3/PF13606_6/11Prominin/PF05478_11/2_8e02Prominin/PF
MQIVAWILLFISARRAIAVPESFLVDCPFYSHASLDGCRNIFDWNTGQVCEVQSSWMPAFLAGWLEAEPSVDRARLNQLSWVQRRRGHSFVRDLLEYVDHSAAWNWRDFGNWVSNSWPPLTLYTLGGLVPTVMGSVWLLILVIIIIPLLIAGLFMRLKPRDVKKPQRIKHFYVALISQVLLAIVVLGCVVVMLSNLNDMDLALNDAPCALSKISQDFLVDGFTSGKSEFSGVSSALVSLKQAATFMEQLTPKIEGPVSLRNLTVVGIKSLFAPIVFTDALLRRPDAFMGWEDAAGVTHEPFSLDMQVVGANLFAAAAQFESDSGDYGLLLSAAELSEDSGHIQPPAGAAQAARSAATATREVYREIEKALPQISDVYESIRQGVVAVRSWAAENQELSYWSAVSITCMPVIGVCFGAILVFFWKHRDRAMAKGRTPRPSTGLRLFSGFLIFGYSIWGCFLFLVGGAILMASYFTSDACNFIERDLFSRGEYDRYSLFRSIPPQIVTACLTYNATGDLLGQYGTFDPNELTGLLNNVTVIDPSLLGSAQIPRLNISTVLATYGVPRVVMPIDYNLLPETDDRIRWSSLAQNRVEQLSPALIAKLQETRTGTVIPIYGLGDVSEALNGYLKAAGCSGHSLCLGTNCAAGDTRILTSTVHRISRRDLDQTVATGFGDATVTKFAASPAMTETVQCLVNSVRISDTEKAAFFNGLWIASRKAAALSSLQRSQAIQDESLIDVCPISEACPLFFHTRRDPQFSLSVRSYSDWEINVEIDTMELSGEGNLAQLAALVTSSAVSYNVATLAAQSIESINQQLQCTPVFDRMSGVERAVCNGPVSSIAGWATGAVLVATAHLVATLMTWSYWQSQRRLPRENLTVSTGTDYDPMSPNSPPLETAVHLPDAVYVTEDEFLYAAEMGHAPDVERAVTFFSPDTVQDLLYHNTPLHLACYYGHYECAEKILAGQWSVDPVNFKKNTPLLAMLCNISLGRNEKAKIAGLLLEHGANANHLNSDGETPISALYKTDCQELLPLLMAHGAVPRDAPPLSPVGNWQ